MEEARRGCGGVEDIDSWAANICYFFIYIYIYRI